MKVRDLKKYLEDIDDDVLVVLSSDSEGNGFSPLSDIDPNHSYSAESSWGGEVGITELTDELKKAGYTEEDVMEDGVPAVIFWPVN